MATLVLTAVGTAVGGPIGGALGSLVGQAIDTQLFGKGPRKGPRLDDLKVQTSTYGSQIPRLYGTMRVAGTVIWATDLVQSEQVEGGGKGSPETLAYHYSCSFAVALSSRPIRSIGRIWADGKLIRGAAGDLKVKGRLRTLLGGEDQAPDALIASLEGAGTTPAYRGLALAVFEDLELGEFGNRLPMLTFEVVADDEPVGLPSLIRDATDGVVNGVVDAEDATVGGYAVFGSDRRAAVDQLCDLFGIEVRAIADTLTTGIDRDLRLDIDEPMGWAADAKTYPARGEWSQDGAGGQAACLSIRYHDPARDYQAGIMRATMPGGRGEMVFDSAAAMTASDAKELAERAMARRWSGRDRMTVRLSPEHLDLVPGDRIETGWRTGRWLVHEVRIEAFAVIAECRRLPGASGSLPADPGRSNAQDDRPIGASTVAVFEIPGTGRTAGGTLQLHVAVSCPNAFKPVALSSFVAGQSGTAGVASRRARLGRAETALAHGPSTIVDARSFLDVILVDPSQNLFNADDQALDAGANLCIVGDEILQFGRAAPLGEGRFRLSRLLRGRQGTEWATARHVAGEIFAMIDHALVPFSFDAGLLGQDVEISTHGVADDDAAPPTARATLRGASAQPLSPCHLGMTEDRITWARRSWQSWSWADPVAADGSSARFEVKISGSLGVIDRIVDVTALALDSEDRDQLGPGPLTVSVIEQSAGRRSMAVEGIF